MSKRKTELFNDEYYHVYNRGNSKQVIFLDNFDKARFITILFVMNQEDNKKVANISKNDLLIKTSNPLVAIGSYVIMDNHYHILLKQQQDGGVTRFMQKVGTAYSGYFNKKYKRTGALFEGRFKAKHANNDIYLKYLFSYIHLNPAKLINSNWKKEILTKQNQNIIIEFLKKYRFSSFQDYAGIQRPEGELLSKNNFPIYFRNNKDFYKNILSWLTLE